MRRWLLMLAGWSAAAGPGLAQFAGDRTPAAGVIPAKGGDTASQPPEAHPWYVKPEHGPWMICVKSYTGPDARVLAEALAHDIRTRYGVPAYLFERGSVERKREQERMAQALAQRKAELAHEEEAYYRLQEQLKAQAAAKGMEFLADRPRISVPTVRIEEQYAVLIGGWPTMEAARRELEKVRRWEAPGNKALMDRQYIVRPSKEEAQANGELAYVNPFLTSMVAPNPVAARPPDPESLADMQLVQKLNSDEEYSVLRITKPWTLAVKHFAPPHQVAGREERGLVERVFKPKGDAMAASGDQAREMVKMLRSMKPTSAFPYGPFEAYVLHTRYGSLVCIGQYDSPEDPKMRHMREILPKLKYRLSRNPDGTGVIEEQPMFTHLNALRIR